MNRRTFFASFVTVLGALKFWKPARPETMMLFDGEQWQERTAQPLTIQSTARPDEVLIVSGGKGYLFNAEAAQYARDFERQVAQDTLSAPTASTRI